MHLNILTLTPLLTTLALALPNTNTHLPGNPNHHPHLHPQRQQNQNQNQTLGHAIIINTCPLPLYLWSVGSTISGQYTLPPNTSYTEPFRRDPQSGGIALKLTRVADGLYGAAPQTVFAYNLVERAVWYDLSDVFGDPFAGRKVRVEYVASGGASGGASGEEGEGEGDEEVGQGQGIEWVDGVPPAGSMVRVADGEGDLVLTLC